MNRFHLLLMALLCPAGLLPAAEQKPFELRDGDRVVFLGDTLVEREMHHGWVELMMTLRFPDRNITFRNLGWSADTPEGISRVSFDWTKGQGEWLRQLTGQVRQTHPTVVVLGYGMASSFDGASGLNRFTAGYNKLLDAILEVNKNIRFILLGPIAHEKLPAPLPDSARHNEMIALYVRAIREIAEKRSVSFVDLTPLTATKTVVPVAAAKTDNGIHLNARGYQDMAQLLAKALAWPAVDLTGREELRQATIRKNQQFFHRWRPENSTYLLLFRKHEQGRNAQEIPQFDPFVHAEEEKIARLRRAEPDRSAAFVRMPAQKPVTDHPATPFRRQDVPTFDLGDTNLEVTLWAENPLLAKPIAMNWDARGRLWVASSSVYPQLAPGQEQEDKVIILEDTDRDQRADKATVFADGLLIPTGIEPGDGGCYVGQSTELLHFKDTDGDGVSDERRVVLSGFGTEDTHHILHTLRWGHDGRLYMNQSIYIHSHIETPHGVVRLNSGGTLALRPDTLDVGIHMKGLINGWGHDFDSFGQSFQTDGAGGQGINWNIPQAMYVTYAGARRILGSVSPGGYPKFCGLELLRSEQFPKEWQGSAITCDFRANRIVRFEIIEQGAAYTTKQHEFMRTTNITFRPVDVKMGPDGALYIADWSNPIIQHGEVDFRDPRRDRVHGRIWRVAHKGGAKTSWADLTKATDAELLERVSSPNGWTQRQARRLLADRAAASLHSSKSIAAWAGRQTEPVAQLEALWLHQAMGQVNTKLLMTLLDAGDARVRAAAVRVLGAWSGHTPGAPTLAEPSIEASTALVWLAKRMGDDHPRVRIEALRALARIPNARSAEIALSVLDHGDVSEFLEYALWLTINDLAEPWIAAVESGTWKVEGREKQLQFALKAIEPRLAGRVMAKVFGETPLPRDGSGVSIELFGQAAGPEQLRRMFEQVLNGGFNAPAKVQALNSLVEAARLRDAQPAGDLSGVLKLLDRAAGDAVVTVAAKLAGTWKLSSATPTLANLAADPAAGPSTRQAAIEGLRELGGEHAAIALRTLASDRESAIRRSAAAALAAADVNGSMPVILGVLGKVTSEEDALALWRSMLTVKDASGAFARAVARTNLPTIVARAGMRVAREAGRSEPDLVLALNKAGGLSDGGDSLTEEEIHNIGYNVPKGYPARGETVYRRKDVGCVVCHAIGGAGGKVGPDLTSLGASTPVVDYIVESVLLPNKKVKEGYNSVTITTHDDEEHSGNLLREDTEQVILRDVTDREISVPKRMIKERRVTGSLMPSGIVDQLTPQERLDLYAFLAQLGMPGPFDGTKQNVARTWFLNPSVGTINADKMLISDLRGREWTPLYATASGLLPREDIRAELPGDVTFWAATRFQTAKAGPVRLAIAGTVSPKVWVNGIPIGGASNLEVDLPAGIHRFFIKITASDLTGPLSLESPEATFLTE